MPSAPRAYQITPGSTLAALGLAQIEVAAPAAPAPDPAPAYGDVRTPIPQGATEAGPVIRLILPDARVHGAEGVVSVGRHVLQESLDHVHPSRAHAVREGPVWITLDDYPARRIPAADSLLYGNVGNYAHWLLDGVGRIGTRPPGDAPALLPRTGAPCQAALPGLLPGLPIRSLAPDEPLQVGRLTWSTSPTHAGAACHPALLTLAARLRAACPPDGPARIYVSRRDARQRRLRNEAEIEALCVARGYVPVTLGDMPLHRQVALFGAARRIVGLHGAALANLLFCQPGAAVLELLMDRYVNFCFRRLAARAGLRYGCLIGPTDPGGDDSWVHAMTWSLDPGRVATALDDPAFQET